MDIKTLAQHVDCYYDKLCNKVDDPGGMHGFCCLSLGILGTKQITDGVGLAVHWLMITNTVTSVMIFVVFAFSEFSLEIGLYTSENTVIGL